MRRLADIGEDFSKLTSPVLDEATRTRTLSYVFAHHRRTLERAKLFLEKDKWDAVPVSPVRLGLGWFGAVSGVKRFYCVLHYYEPLCSAFCTYIICSVSDSPQTFNFLKLKEFAFLRKRRDLTRQSSSSRQGEGEEAAPAPTPRKEKGPLDRFSADQDMFHIARNAPEDSDAVGTYRGGFTIRLPVQRHCLTVSNTV